MRVFPLLLLLTGLLFGDARQEALTLAHQSGQLLDTDPAEASRLAGEAFHILQTAENSAQADLAACAGMVARSARLAGDHQRAREWFLTTLNFASPENSVIIRSEFADMLMRDGDLALARQTLGPSPTLPLPSLATAQWQQTSAKLHLACGLPENAHTAINAAINALPPGDTANQVALAIDAAGIALRLDLEVARLVEGARHKLLTLPDPPPEFISALTSIASQAPGLTEQQSLALLQSVDLETLPGEARLTFSITLAEAAARAGNASLVTSTLSPVLTSDLLPDDHPLLAKALALAANAASDPVLAKQSSQVALRWLDNSDDSEILLGLQRTVDPISPLIELAPDALPDAALASQNFALRKRLGGKVAPPIRQTVLYLIYQKNFTQHYGALVFNPTPHWIDLGPAEPIHSRIVDTIETADRTLGEVEVGARLPVRLTQLGKSLWLPLKDLLNPDLPIDIAPVGMLHAVPWATLRQRDGQSLCETCKEVRILALTGHFPTQVTSETLLACGTSSAPGILVAGGEFPFDDHLAELMKSLPALPGVKSELALFDTSSHENPNRSDFLRLIARCPGTLHLAGHGFVIESEEGHGFRAGLIFHGGGPQNILFAREIADLDFSGTELVVLSACRGGIGQSEVGGNWSSLRRSFIAAGARQVLAAQWQVRDDQLTPFMKSFYQKRKNLPAHLALWSLQKELVKKGTDLDLAAAGAWVLECVPQD